MMTDTDSKPRRGRPPKDPERLLQTINVRLSKSMLEQIEAVAKARGPETDRADVVREMIARGLEKQE